MDVQWAERSKFYGFLKIKLTGIVRTMVEAVGDENGFEAWIIINK